MYNIVLISPSLLTSCLHTDTLSKPPSQSSEVQETERTQKHLERQLHKQVIPLHRIQYIPVYPLLALLKKLLATNGKK